MRAIYDLPVYGSYVKIRNAFHRNYCKMCEREGMKQNIVLLHRNLETAVLEVSKGLLYYLSTVADHISISASQESNATPEKI